jgi:hypothetical protein
MVRSDTTKSENNSQGLNPEDTNSGSKNMKKEMLRRLYSKDKSRERLDNSNNGYLQACNEIL